jgi:hypothetical protein
MFLLFLTEYFMNDDAEYILCFNDFYLNITRAKPSAYYLFI